MHFALQKITTYEGLIQKSLVNFGEINARSGLLRYVILPVVFIDQIEQSPGPQPEVFGPFLKPVGIWLISRMAAFRRRLFE
jgi:hypothetical protein